MRFMKHAYHCFSFILPFKNCDPQKGVTNKLLDTSFGSSIIILTIAHFRKALFKLCGKRKKWCNVQVCMPALFEMAAG